jgi:uncharacterized protein (DUF58 family)
MSRRYLATFIVCLIAVLLTALPTAVQANGFDAAIVSASTPSTKAGQRFSVKVTVKNRGTLPTPLTVVRAKLYSMSGGYVVGTSKGFTGLGPGEEKILTLYARRDAKLNPKGKHVIKITLEGSGMKDDTNSGNDQRELMVNYK